MSIGTYSYLTLFAPLVGALVIALAGTRLPQRAAGWIGSLAVLVSFVNALGALAVWRTGEHEHAAVLTPYTWLTAGAFNVGFDLYIDPLSLLEMLIVSGVGMLIVFYSIGYMAGDPQERRFFAYMDVFVFSMLMLVMAGNLVLLLVGWGLVGMASYLLIGFWHDRASAVAAAKKAFIINAAGDVSLMLGLFLIFAKVGVVDYATTFGLLPSQVATGSGTALAICLLLLGGALAKSAQLPLHTWLPDAMEGPTPVSALIHAATMVTAGVFLVARMWPVFDLSVVAQQVVALIGAFTLVVAGLLALVQTDIKRVIAYSTMSQIGYMFVAVGVGAYSAGMFHLMTHAFFKALLFLGAGIVIHRLADQQDVREMGGLRRHMPITYGLFVIATLALAGVIPLSGFFSKDEILMFAFASVDAQVFGGVGFLVWMLGLVGVVLTGIYSFRLLFLVFHGEEGAATRAAFGGVHEGATATPADAAAGHAHAAGAHAHAHAGEAPATMMWPVLALGALAASAGLLVIPGVWNVLGDFLHGAHAAPTRAAVEAVEPSAQAAWLLALLISLPLAALGITIATLVWKTGRWSALRHGSPGVERALQGGLWFDALQDRLLLRPAAWLGRALRTGIEDRIVGPSMQLVARTVRLGGSGIGALQSGLLRAYTFATALAIMAIVVWYVAAKG